MGRKYVIDEVTCKHIANELRAKYGYTSEHKIAGSEFYGLLHLLKTGADTDECVGLIDGTLTAISSDKVTAVRDYGFYYKSNLESVNFPNAASIGTQAFRACSTLAKIYFPKAASIAANAFAACSALEVAEFDALTSIGNQAFLSCLNLKALIIRTPTVCTAGTNILSNAGYSTEAGFTYIYVPALHIEDYKLATNLVKYAAQFRALEDYTVDGTIMGALDESKI